VRAFIIIIITIHDFVLFQLQNGSLPFKKSEFVLAWFLRELTAPFLFINALCRPSIRWRTGMYRLKWGGVVEEVDHPKVKL